jgi:hypothetical protein
LASFLADLARLDKLLARKNKPPRTGIAMFEAGPPAGGPHDAIPASRRWQRRQLWEFFRMKLSLIAIALLVASVAHAQTQQRFYDEQGRFTGTAKTSPAGSTNYYNEQGRFTGTAKTSPTGSTNYYNEQGRFTGSSRTTNGTTRR